MVDNNVFLCASTGDALPCTANYVVCVGGLFRWLNGNPMLSGTIPTEVGTMSALQRL